MRETLVLSVDAEIAQFIQAQQGLVDPSALMNKLFHEDMRRKGIRPNPELRSQLEQDEVLQGLEFLMDENTHPAE